MRMTPQTRTADEIDAFEHRRETCPRGAKAVKTSANRWDRRTTSRVLRAAAR